jgi:anaerobic ribonucleoside-triphosphate reductase activating protein
MKLRIHSFLAGSYANGPGCRAVLWTQGCPLRCPGCFNPTTHPFDQGQWVEVDDLVTRIQRLGSRLEGVTISGGEPLAQRPAVSELLRLVKAQTLLSVVLLTGYTWAEVRHLSWGNQGEGNPQESGREAAWPGLSRLPEFLRYVDVLIAGRYDRGQRLAHGLRGSANKTVHFLTRRYSPQDIEAVPPAEVIVLPEGQLVLSGIDPVRLTG